MDHSAIASLFETYRKYGWIPRRLLLTPSSRICVDEHFIDVPIFESSIDAAWFSRPPAIGKIAWEIRYLGTTPYALLEDLDEALPDFEEKLTQVQARLSVAVAAKSN